MRHIGRNKRTCFCFLNPSCSASSPSRSPTPASSFSPAAPPTLPSRLPRPSRPYRPRRCPLCLSPQSMKLAPRLTRSSVPCKHRLASPRHPPMHSPCRLRPCPCRSHCRRAPTPPLHLRRQSACPHPPRTPHRHRHRLHLQRVRSERLLLAPKVRLRRRSVWMLPRLRVCPRRLISWYRF